ncbi:hypothetical protein CA267_001890 [Alteromonas pelagimontana]|uniref:Uncharacterized protein n=1 Tax=Alteromonas pelagimontana TaxID=1858656 RepID=A0A6M4MAN8_9ALTE|nr:hypothetical protein [Alteromonas pelagimontana]QJR79635.1 hypothetical protein CA267_001890 [Alteromonas pelagimontana]
MSKINQLKLALEVLDLLEEYHDITVKIQDFQDAHFRPVEDVWAGTLHLSLSGILVASPEVFADFLSKINASKEIKALITDKNGYPVDKTVIEQAIQNERIDAIEKRLDKKEYRYV